MRRMTSLGLLAAVLALAGCKKDSATTGGGTGGPPPGPTVNLEGAWLLTGMEMGGEAMPADFLSKEPEAERTMKVTADKMIFTKKGKEDPATYKADTSKTPHEIDMVGKKGDGKDDKMYGIFKVEGDKLTICAAPDNPADRPKEFKTTKDGKSMIMILEKKK